MEQLVFQDRHSTQMNSRSALHFGIKAKVVGTVEILVCWRPPSMTSLRGKVTIERILLPHSLGSLAAGISLSKVTRNLTCQVLFKIAGIAKHLTGVYFAAVPVGKDLAILPAMIAFIHDKPFTLRTQINGPSQFSPTTVQVRSRIVIVLPGKCCGLALPCGLVSSEVWGSQHTTSSDCVATLRSAATLIANRSPTRNS